MSRTRISKTDRRPFAAFVVGVFVLTFGGGAFGEEGTLNTSVSTTSGLQGAAKKDESKDWRKETEATCGMACRYHRANDNLTLQALYLVTKLQKIDAAIQKDSNSPSARTALGAFCSSNSEDLSKCFPRYQAFQRVGLLEIRQSIGKNEDTIAKLTTGRGADGKVVGTALAFESGTEAVPYMPDVPTLAELEQSYLDGKLKPKGKPYSRAEIMEWSQTLIINDPNTRYLEFNKKPVVGNPYQKEESSYSLNTEKKSYGDQTSPDARAVRLYKDAEGKIREYAEDKANSIKGDVDSTGLSAKDQKNVDQMSYDAFTDARSVINSKIETDVKKKEAETRERKIASEKKPTPEPSGSPPADAADSASAARDVKVTVGKTATRIPSGMKRSPDDYKVERPPEMKNSRYIKYDVSDLLNDIEDSTH
jgi:hypothetical protein